MAARGYEVAARILGCVWPQDSHPAEDHHGFHPVALWSMKQREQPLAEGPVNIQVPGHCNMATIMLRSRVWTVSS